MHWLLFYTVEFVKRHGLWGTASEQPIKNFYEVMSRDLKQFCAIKNKKILFLQLTELNSISNYFFDNEKLNFFKKIAFCYYFMFTKFLLHSCAVLTC